MIWAKLHKARTHMMILAMLILVFSTIMSSTALAQGELAYVRHVRAIETGDLGIPNPAGLAFSPGATAFYVVEARRPAQPIPRDTYLVKVTPYEERGASARIVAAIHDPINMAFDSQANRLLILQPASNRLIEVLEGPDGNLDPATLFRHDARHFGLQNPQGMAVDPANGHLFILDGAGPRIVRIEPNPSGGFDGAVISEIDLGQIGVTDVRGLALDPISGHFHLLDPSGQKLLELTQMGHVVATRDLSEFGLVEPQGMVIAPSGDLTDDPTQMSLYIADSGSVAQQTQASGPAESRQGANAGNEAQQRPGNITEFSFTEIAAADQADFVAALVKITDTATYSPPSPDPSGLAYLPSSDTLLMCDGEVEETVGGITHFQGVNVWETTLGGNMVHTANISSKAPTVVPMTDEPTGVAWNPANGHFYFADDDAGEVYDLNPGADGQVGTADDTWTSFDTDSAGSGDPEGIAYDSWNDRLFVVDGTNAEVYEFTLSGSLVGHFDVQTLGIVDPESVEFNPANGTLFVLSDAHTSPQAIETTTSGTLLQTIDVSAANAVTAAGLAYAPASNGSGAMRFYIVDRGIDNNTNPHIIDGKMYELTAPPIVGNVPPLAIHDSAGTVENIPVTIDVAANDIDLNGNLDPASVNVSCTTCEGPANGTLGKNVDGSFTYTPTLDYLGSDSFVYEICDTEPLCDTAAVTIIMGPAGSILIDGGATYATSTSVALTLSFIGSGVDAMHFSNNGITWSAWEPYASSKAWTLPSGDGNKTVYVQYRDQTGHVSRSYSDSIILDTAAPTGSILIDGGAAYAASTSVALTLSASDSGSGVDDMRFSNSGTSWSAWEPYASTKSWTLLSGDGAKTVYVQYRDLAGNVSSSYTDSIILDTAVPTGSILINGGAAYATSTSVALTLSASDSSSGVSAMRFSNDGTSWSTWEPYASTKSWTLPSGDGNKTVYVQYRDLAGNVSSSYSDSIILDTAAPTGSILINGGAAYAASTSVALTLSASDAGSGVSEMRFSNDGSTWSAWEPYAGSKAWTLPSGDGSKTVYVQYRDPLGHVSSSYTDSIILDTVAPTGSIVIDGGAAYATSTSVELTLSASDSGSGVDEMRLSDNGTSWGAWEPYAGSKSWTLSSGDGSKTVYVQYRDQAGRVSVSYSDSIVLDTAAPTGSILIEGGAAYATSTSVALTLSASDTGSGLDEMRFSNNGTSWSAWEPYASSKSWTLPSGDGSKTVYVQYRDQAGNASSSYSDGIILDTAVPTGSIVIDGGATYATSTSVALTLSASDSGSGMDKMRFSDNGTSWSAWETYASSKAWTLPSGDGSKTVYVQYRDQAGNVSLYSDGIILDTVAPTGSISIEGGAAYATSTSVALTLSASDSGSGVDDMRFSNSGTSWSAWEPYASTKSWTLPSGDGSKTVYVQYRDQVGHVSPSYSDNIVLDTVAPTGSIVIDGGAAYATSTSVELTLSASDPGSGMSEMHFANSGDTWSAWEPYASSKTWTLPANDGFRMVYVQYRDNAGNISSTYSDGIILDTAAPTGSILIEGGAAYAASTSVALTLSASDSGSGVDKMRFSDNDTSWSAWETYASSKAWTLPSGDGSKTVYVQYHDQAGNVSSSYSDSIVLDTAAPTGSILIEGGAAYATSTSVALTLSASDSGSGVDKMRFSNSGTSWSAWEPYASSKSWTLPSGDGSKTVYVQYRDQAGNVSSSYSDGIILDTAAPTGSIVIDGGAAYATSTSVALTLSASDSGSGVDEMRFSNSGTSWSAWEPYASSKSWTLASGDGSKTVYVQYRDQAGNVSLYSDGIILDRAAPTGSISINGGDTYATSTSATLSLSANDGTSGVADMRFSDDGTSWGTWEPYASSKAWTLPSGDGSKTVYVQYRDQAGNVSPTYSDSIILDTAVPTGSIVIDGGAAYATSTSVELTLSASDSGSGVDDVRFSDNGTSWSTWEPYASSKAWTLPSGDGGKTVYVQYRDQAGNVSSSYNDSIILDTAAPAGSIVINGGDTYATSASVDLMLSASDETSGMSEMRFSDNGTSWSTWEPYASSKSWTLPPGDGATTVYVQYSDQAGNVSSSYSDSIILDTAAPTGSIVIDGGAGYAASTSVMLTLSANDGTSGVDDMRFSDSGTSWSTWEPYASSKAWTLPSRDGTKTVYVQYRDQAENVSSPYSDSIVLDTVAPSGSIVINGGDTYAISASATLSLSASDEGSGVEGMHFSDDGSSWSGWEAYASSKAWSLPSGDGSKTVYVEYRDHLGQVSSASSDTITLDTTPPSSAATSPSRTTSDSFVVSWSGADNLSGIATYDVQYRVGSSGSWSSWLSEVSESSAVFGPANRGQTYYFQVRATDNAGNLEAYPGGDGDTSTFVQEVFLLYLPLTLSGF